MPLQSTSGAASYDAFGGGVAAIPKYIEDYFSTFLYQGTGATQSITNNIDLSTKGGMVWAKARSGTYSTATGPVLFDTARGVGNAIFSNYTGAQANYSNTLTAFNTSGFSLGADAVNTINGTGTQYASWSFAKAPKFFDVVTYTGDGTDDRAISHNLGSTPGCIIVKRSTSSFGTDWAVYHRSLGVSSTVYLNKTNAATGNNPCFGSSSPTSTTFTVTTSGGNNDSTNWTGGTYVAYVFAHNAGGFGLTGTDNVISCGSFTPDSSGNVDVNLGYEPQWILFKRSAVAGSWSIADTMRGMSYSDFNRLYANLSNAEDAQPAAYCVPTATGFKSVTTGVFSANEPHIYIAIRRGPMKVPTSGTSVFAPVANTQSSGTVRTIGFPADLAISTGRTTNLQRMFNDRLRGFSQTNKSTGPRLFSNTTDAENTSYTGVGAVTNTGYQDGDYFDPGISMIRYLFGRAPSFFDEVCYQGNGVSGRAISHNLGVAPELMIVKSRSSSSTSWVVGSTAIGVNNNVFLQYNGASANYGATFFYNTNPTSSVFYVGSDLSVNASVPTYVAYLFATCAGVSKCFNYTGNGSSQTINCGFTAGARWILIKRTDSTGDWYVWDSARGIVSGNDPHLSLNTTDAEVTTDDTIDTDSTGFVVNQVSATNVNVSSATYIGIAIA